MKSDASFLVRNIPAADHVALVELAADEGTNVAAIIATLLAKDVRASWRPETRPASAPSRSTTIEVPLPLKVRQQFKAKAAQRGESMNGRVLALIADYVSRMQAAA
jgi:hypothetical protein